MLYNVGNINAFYNEARGQMVSKLLRKEINKLCSPSKTTSNLY